MPNVEVARQQWEEGYRRVLGLRSDARFPDVMGLVETLVDELRRRVGSTFTLDELAASYPRAEEWAQERLDGQELPPGWTRWLSTALDSAFHLYARGARDYRP